MSFQAMIRSGYLKKFLLPGSVCAAVVKAATDQDFACDPKTGQLIRRSDLPIYSSDICESREDKDVEQSGLEQRISVVRKELWVWYDQYKGYRQKVVEVIDTGKAHTQPQEKPPRASHLFFEDHEMVRCVNVPENETPPLEEKHVNEAQKPCDSEHEKHAADKVSCAYTPKDCDLNLEEVSITEKTTDDFESECTNPENETPLNTSENTEEEPVLNVPC